MLPTILDKTLNILQWNANGICNKQAELSIGQRVTSAPNDTAYKRWSCHCGLKLLCKLCRTRPQQWGPNLPFFGHAWLALLLTKSGDVETNLGTTTLNNEVWICDICHKQIHVRKQMSIRCRYTQIPGRAIYTDNSDTPVLTLVQAHNQITDTCPTLPMSPQDW